MKIYEIFCFPDKNEKKINTFKIDFVTKYKHKCKIIFNNKLYPLKSHFDFINSNKKYLKIKLLCFSNISNLYSILSEDLFEAEYYELPNKISKYINYRQGQKCFFCKIPKIIYNSKPLPIEQKSVNKYDFFMDFIPEEKGIRIFGKEFVENNKDKCIIAYKDRLFSLREYFLTKDIDKTDKTLEIFLIELKNINDYYFSKLFIYIY